MQNKRLMWKKSACPWRTVCAAWLFFFCYTAGMVSALAVWGQTMVLGAKWRQAPEYARAVTVQVGHASRAQVQGFLMRLADSRLPAPERMLVSGRQERARIPASQAEADRCIAGIYDAQGPTGFDSLDSTDMVCMINANTRPPAQEDGMRLKHGARVMLYHKTYTVVGLREAPFAGVTAMLPVGTYLQNGFPVKTIRCVYRSVPTRNQRRLLMELKNLHCVTALELPGRAAPDIPLTAALCVYVVLFGLMLSVGVVSVWLWSFYIRQTNGKRAPNRGAGLGTYISPPLAGCIAGAWVYLAAVRDCLPPSPGMQALGIAVCTGTVLAAVVLGWWIPYIRQRRRL